MHRATRRARTAGTAAALVLPLLWQSAGATAPVTTSPAGRGVEPALAGPDQRLIMGEDAVLPTAEIDVAVDPRDPRRVAVAAIRFGRPYQEALVEGPFSADDHVWVSGDSGRTFTDAGGLPPLQPGTPASNDPTLAWSPRGGALYASYTSFTGDGSRLEGTGAGLYVARSNDGGRSWRRSKRLEGFDCSGPDRSTVAVDPRHGDVVVTWTHYRESGCDGAPDFTKTLLRMARSRDGGRTFGRPVDIAPPGAANQVVPAALPDGTVVTVHLEVAGLRTEDPLCQFPYSAVATRWSRDGRRLGTTVGARGCNTTGGVSPNGSAHVPLTFPALAAHPRTGALVLAFPTIGGDGVGVRTATSSDGGLSWSQSVVTGLPGSTASMVAVAAGPRDLVALAWLEVDPGGAYRPVLSASGDRGATWSAPLVVSDLPSVGNVRSGLAFDGYDIGHYLGVDVGPDGVAHVAWPDLRPEPETPADPDVHIRAVRLD